ncbi:uncharacterized protein LOC143851038 [Tasmannia lanceolata]|uniref:uncharacterized protein LOC143851038 n=1 Tax=Tasmannia lanceolata TaxID=3420 RepID=UPI00406296F3
MSRPQVTITLGRSGQVVKKAGPTTEGIRSDYVPLSGSKRPIRERLGSNAENLTLYAGQSKSKRQRGDSHNWSLSDDDANDGKQYTSNAGVGRGDLRFKLMRKNLSRQPRSYSEHHSDVDLREKLSRTVQSPLRNDTRQRFPEPHATNLMRRVPPTRSADDLLQMDSLRKSNSSWTLDGLRRRSPDSFLGASRGISPLRIMDNRRQAPSVLRSVDALRPSPYMIKGVVDASRPTSLMTKATVPLEVTKPIALLPPPNIVLQKSSYTVEEPLTVSGLLQSLGLGKYSILFQAEEVDMTALKQMRDNDLKELGIPMGPRKKILLALLPRSKHLPS